MVSVLLVILLVCPLLLALPPKSFRDDVVKRHNEIRRLHQVGPVRENIGISWYAQSWADHLARTGTFRHRPRNKYGENLSWMWPSATGVQHVNNLYTKEEQYYRSHGYYNREPPMSTFTHYGHFTQIVWKGSREIGIGKAKGIVVINYHPPGNYIGSFRQNVFPPRSENETLYN